MTTLSFDRSIDIVVGFGFPTAIRSVFMANHILTEWPSSRRGPTHAAALAACRMALNGTGEVADAYEAFRSFASRASILAEVDAPIIAAKALQDIQVVSI